MNIDRAVSFAPLASLLTLAMVAIFNVGYFGRVGLHFIGIMDLSNLVYSFGLSFIFVIMALQLSIMFVDVFDFSRSIENREKYRWRISYVAGPIGLILILVVIILYLTSQLSWSPWLTVLFFVFSFGYQFCLLAINYHEYQRLSWDHVAYTSIAAAFLTSSIGGLVAHTQATRVDNSYSVETATLTLVDARLMRSSSNGFLFVAADRVLFIPRDQIRLIRSNVDWAK